MRLFHVSEEENIEVFEPRLPKRNDLDRSVGLVWAICEYKLPNFLTPRNCPRVAYNTTDTTTEEDKLKFFTSPSVSYAVVIEHGWFEAVRSTTLYMYEFDPADFTLQDTVAGYYVSTKTQTPIAKYRLDDLPYELIRRNVELRITDNLWTIADLVKQSTLDWSLCRMSFASPRTENTQTVSHHA